MHHESITSSSSILAAAFTRWIGPALLITAEQQRAALLAQDCVEGTHYGLADYESVQPELLSGLRQEHINLETAVDRLPPHTTSHDHWHL